MLSLNSFTNFYQFYYADYAEIYQYCQFRLDNEQVSLFGHWQRKTKPTLSELTCSHLCYFVVVKKRHCKTWLLIAIFFLQNNTEEVSLALCQRLYQHREILYYALTTIDVNLFRFLLIQQVKPHLQ